MIPLLVRASWTNLRRDRAAQVLVFVVPIAFFSIFATVFGGRDMGSAASRLPTVVVDESHTETSTALVATLAADSGLRVITRTHAGRRDTAGTLIDRAHAEAMVRAGEVPVALVLPAGIDTSLARFDGRGGRVVMFVDPSDPIAPKMTNGLLQRAVLEVTRAAADEFRGADAAGTRPPIEDLMPARIESHEVAGKRRGHSMVAFYAAGIAVMFLMFSASGGGGALIEENESGTLERVLSTGLGMTRLLAAKWLYLAGLGVLQITVMFAWAVLVFRLDLSTHLAGVAAMTLATAASTAAFGLVLATAARTRAQLQGLANIVVLSLSALGGSMFPRFLMSESLQRASRVGFNAWALDGFIKVLWNDVPVAGLWRELGMLALFTLAFLALARRLARRWETA